MIDPIIQTKTCPISGKEFSITQGDLDFYNKISPTFAGQKFQIPTPTLCPEERGRRRLSFRNERNLYKRKCDASGKDIISIYSPDKTYRIYDQKIRRSDSRDPLSYGQDFDFSKTFTENFRELMQKVPKMGLMIQDSINSDYSNLAIGNKDCYLTFGGDFSESCYYTTYGFRSYNCMDGYWLFDCNNCYDCCDLYNCTGCSRCQIGKDLYDCILCLDCKGCNSCIGCIGLENQKYHIFNIAYSKEEFETFKANLQNKEYLEQTRLKFKQHIQSYPHTIIDITGCENCSGKRITNSKNCKECKDIEDGEDCSYNFINAGIKSSQDTSQAGHGTHYSYNSLGIASSSTIICSNYIWGANNNIYYCIECMNNCSNLFGCTGLRNKSYCIFNKQYTKEEYEIQVAKIISHMIETQERGEFFHPSLSPFGYNETVANEYYPLQYNVGTQYLASVNNASSRTDNDPSLQPVNLKDFGYHRSDYQSPAPMADKIIDGNNLPTSINEISDDILKTAIRCEITGKLFRIIPQELAFYRKHQLPLPHRHPDQRHLDRLALRK